MYTFKRFIVYVPVGGHLSRVPAQDRPRGNRSAAATKLAGPSAIADTNDNNVGFAVDPVADAMWVGENGSNANSVIDAAGSVTGEADLAFAAGDPNFGLEPGVQALGYTNQREGAKRTRLFGIDEFNDVLVRISPPAAGTMETVGPLGFDTTFGFDLDIVPGGAAFAVLKSQLFRVNLRSGEATRLGTLGRPDEGGVIPGYGRPYSTALVPRRLVD